jgi:hypothetical protein
MIYLVIVSLNDGMFLTFFANQQNFAKLKMDYYNSDEDDCCPLCMEEIEVDDKYFKPCPCGYQVSL